MDLDDESSTSAVDSHRHSHRNHHLKNNLRSSDDTRSSCHTTGGDSDFRAVEWLRNRSAESRGSSNGGRATELSPAAAKAWKEGHHQQQGQRHHPSRIHRSLTAREESIEVDDLTLLGIPRSSHHNHRTISAPPTASTSSSSFECAPGPTLVAEDLPSEEATTARQSDELDAIVHALTQPATKQNADTDARRPYGGTVASANTNRGSNFRGSLPTAATGATTKTLDDDDYEQMLLAGATTQEFLADFDSPHHTAWSPDAPSQSTFRTAASTPFQASTASASTRYVMQASPRSSPPSSPPRSGGPRRVRTVEQLRSLGPLGSAAPSMSTAGGVGGGVSVPHPNSHIRDSLSDVPSDVDPRARERYLRACRLLKSALIERETALLPQERVFLHSLLQHSDDDHDDFDPRAPPHRANRDRALFDDWEDRTSAIETASLTLLSDPLFQVDSVHSSTFELVEESHRRSSSFSRGGSGSHLSDEKKDTFSEAGATGVDNGRSAPDATPPAPSNTVARFDGREVPFYILGISPDFRVGALTPTLMEALRGFFPAALADENLFLKYSLHRDGPSLPALLSKVRTSQHTVLAVETSDGHVFGAFCSAPWRVQSTWFGNAETSFLWRLKRPRILPGTTTTTGRDFSRDSEMEVYPCTGRNSMIQYCTTQTLAVGGGEWSTTTSRGNAPNQHGDDRCPYPDEPSGIGFMIDGDLMGGETNSCSTFANPRLGQRLSKGNEFDIRCLEVWTGKRPNRAAQSN